MDDLIYIAGGCDNANGNIPTNLGHKGGFWCPSISNSLYVYSPSKDTFTQLAELPRARFRHAAVAVNGRIWLIGGLNEGYDIVNKVDVFDTATGQWSTPGVLDTVTSDLAAFAHENTIYFAGGYKWESIDRSLASDEVRSFHSVDALVESDDENYVIKTKLNDRSLDTPRGDVHAASWGPWVYVAGGFTTINAEDDNKCNPLSTVEMFDFEIGGHGQIRPLLTARGDKGLVAMNGILFAIGGEVKENCDNERVAIAQVVDDAEAFDATNPLTSEWYSIGKINNDKFRFTTVAYPKLERIYTFGGQYFYNEDCECYKTSSHVMHYQYEGGIITEDPDKVVELSAGEVAGVVIAVLILVGLTAYGSRKYKQRQMKREIIEWNAKQSLEPSKNIKDTRSVAESEASELI